MATISGNNNGPQLQKLPGFFAQFLTETFFSLSEGKCLSLLGKGNSARVKGMDFNSHEILDSARNAVVQEDTLEKFLVSVAQNPSGPRLQFLIWNQQKCITWDAPSRDPLLGLQRRSPLNIAEKRERNEMISHLNQRAREPQWEIITRWRWQH